MEWHRRIQAMVDLIDECIKGKSDEHVTLEHLSRRMECSESHISRRFREITGMQFRDYLRQRKLAFACKELRDTNKGCLEIALDFGFSSQEAFTRSFKEAYGLTPGEYRRHPVPMPLRTVIRPLDCYLAEHGKLGIRETAGEVQTYFVTIPAHQFLHIRNYESIGYWDFWQKQSQIPGQDCETICGLLDSIPDKLDAIDSSDPFSGQIMGYLNDPAGRICSWGIPLAECYGVRLLLDYRGPVPSQMQLMQVEAGEYLVFEHGPFDYEKECKAVEAKIEKAMREFDYAASGYSLDLTPGRIFYYYHDCKRYWKYIRPVKKSS